MADKNIASRQELRVEKSARMEKLLTAQDDRQYILFHNHPMSSPPSVSDLNSLYQYRDKIKFGVIVGHDGTVYKYTAPVEEIDNTILRSALYHYESMGYSRQTAQVKAYFDLSKKYGFVLEVIRYES